MEFLIALLLILCGILYVIYFSIIVSSNGRYGWGTIFLIYRLYKKDNGNHFIFNFDRIIRFITDHNPDISILLDPISFLLILCLLFCYLIKIKILKVFKIFKGDLFKSYNKVESEKVLDKLTE